MLTFADTITCLVHFSLFHVIVLSAYSCVFYALLQPMNIYNMYTLYGDRRITNRVTIQFCARLL